MNNRTLWTIVGVTLLIFIIGLFTGLFAIPVKDSGSGSGADSTSSEVKMLTKEADDKGAEEKAAEEISEDDKGADEKAAEELSEDDKGAEEKAAEELSESKI